MPNYTQYNREDFLADESFSNYLLQKNKTDIQIWEKWINENPQYSDEVKQARLLFFLIREKQHLSALPSNKEEIENQYSKLRPLLTENAFVSQSEVKLYSKEKPINRRSPIRRIVWQAAAVAAVLILAFSSWFYFGAEKKGNEFLPYAKTTDAVKDVTLPDGSRILLNSYSSLEVAKTFNNNKREVLLNGSAFFRVYKDHSKPFIVTTGNIKTTALGTAFYIYNLNRVDFSVSLVEGKVKVEGDQNYLELLPGEKAFYNSGNAIFKDAFNKNQLIGFTNGKIQFEHANLLEIKTILAEYFNKEVSIEGKPPKINFTGNFDSKKIETILEALQFTYNITYRSAGQKLVISF